MRILQRQGFALLFKVALFFSLLKLKKWVFFVFFPSTTFRNLEAFYGAATMGNQFRWQATNASRAQGDWQRDFLDEPIGHGNGKTTSILVSLYYIMWVPIVSCINQQWVCAKRDGCTMNPYPLHQNKNKKKPSPLGCMWKLLIGHKCEIFYFITIFDLG